MDRSLLLLGAVLVGALLALSARRGWKRFALRLRMARARRGERNARGLLLSNGFDVLAEQARGEAVVVVDGTPARFAVRADYLVRRGARSFVAEVKTGAHAPSIAHAPTRRQLLEYASAFAADGVLLVDVEAGAIREVRFRAPREPGWSRFVAGVATGMGIAIGVWFALR